MKTRPLMTNDSSRQPERPTDELRPDRVYGKVPSDTEPLEIIHSLE